MSNIDSVKKGVATRLAKEMTFEIQETIKTFVDLYYFFKEEHTSWFFEKLNAQKGEHSIRDLFYKFLELRPSQRKEILEKTKIKYHDCVLYL
ncbi:MAG: hypothetical protein N3A54_02475 [Patescibacteria group bacterium]|nr:hypothetical protein [Patescibacteria group bacterium]